MDKYGAGMTFDRDMKSQLFEFMKELVLKWKTDSNIDILNNSLETFTRYNQAGQLAGIIKEMEK